MKKSESFLPYAARLTPFARNLRQHMTLGEVLLWKRIKGKQILGLQFQRQRPLGDYVADFYCKALQLAIEVDGGSHNDRQDEDEHRAHVLEQMGVTVLHVWDNDVRHDMNAVVAQIENKIQEMQKRNPPPASRTPPREGIPE